MSSMRLVDWEEVRAFEVANDCGFFSSPLECGCHVLFEGDLEHDGDLEEATVRRWLVAAGQRDAAHPLLVVSGSLRVSGSVMLGYDLAEKLRGHYEYMSFDLLVMGDLNATNLAPGDRSWMLVVGRTTLSGGLFLFDNGPPTQLKGPATIRWLVGDPEEGGPLMELENEPQQFDDIDEMPENERPKPFEGVSSDDLRQPKRHAGSQPKGPSPIELRRQAAEALSSGDFEQARALIERAHSRYPDDAECLIDYAAMLLPDDPVRALGLASGFVEGQPGYERALCVQKLGGALTRERELRSEAETAREQAAVDHFLAAVRAFRARDFESCAQSWVESVEASRSLGDDAAREALLAFFDWLGGGHALSQRYRRALMMAL